MIASTFEQARFNMVQQQIRPWEVLDQRVLALINEIPRELFVPDEYRGLAYADIEIPIGQGQRMMFPRVEARMLQALDVQPTDRVLEIGTGSGYVTTCLSKLGGKLISLDIHAQFTEQAREPLQTQGCVNAQLRTADGLEGVVEGGPFDVIAVTGSLAEIPDQLKSQLNIGGRMFLVTGAAPAMEANLVTRVGDSAWRVEGLFETELQPLINAPEKDLFEF